MLSSYVLVNEDVISMYYMCDCRWEAKRRAKIFEIAILSQIFEQWRRQRDSISKEANTNNDLNLHLHDQMSASLLYVKFTCAFS